MDHSHGRIISRFIPLPEAAVCKNILLIIKLRLRLEGPFLPGDKLRRKDQACSEGNDMPVRLFIEGNIPLLLLQAPALRVFLLDAQKRVRDREDCQGCAVHPYRAARLLLRAKPGVHRILGFMTAPAKDCRPEHMAAHTAYRRLQPLYEIRLNEFDVIVAHHDAVCSKLGPRIFVAKGYWHAKIRCRPGIG